MTRTALASPRIVILSSSAGGGHVRAAEAIQSALREVCPQAHVEHHDVLQYTTSPVRTFYAKTYFDAIRVAPHLVGFIYDQSDKPIRDGWFKDSHARFRGGVNRINFRRLVPLLIDGDWDLAINTHFIPADLIGSLRRAGQAWFPQTVVATDFYAHRMWTQGPCERYFAASEEAKISIATHAPRTPIVPTGIPVHPVFAQPKDLFDCRRLHGLSDDRPVVLQLAGGLGFGPVEEIHRRILAINRPVHVVMVCGKNQALPDRIGQIELPVRHRRTILGFTRSMDELMAAADVIVTKPGGLTVAETLARGAAMLIVDPIPGQEARNADFLLENGAAVKAGQLSTLTYKLETLLTEPGRLPEIRRKAKALGRPRAAYDVVEQSLALIGEVQKPVQRTRRFLRRRRVEAVSSL